MFNLALFLFFAGITILIVHIAWASWKTENDPYRREYTSISTLCAVVVLLLSSSVAILMSISEQIRL